MNTTTLRARARVRNLLALSAGLFTCLLAGAAGAGEIVNYVLTDHLGSPAIIQDASRVLIKQEMFDPYGDAMLSPNDSGIGYTGHMSDGDTGLVYMQARYYDPEIGRFLSTDPVTFSPDKPQQFNRYWYANGNPIGNIDPSGEASVTATFDTAAARAACSAGQSGACGRLQNLSKVESTVREYDKKIGSMSDHPEQKGWVENSNKTTVVYDPEGSTILTFGADAEYREMDDGTREIAISDGAIDKDNVDTSLAPAYRTVMTNGGARVLAGNGNVLKAAVAHEMGHGNDPSSAKLESKADEHIKEVFPEVLR